MSAMNLLPASVILLAGAAYTSGQVRLSRRGKAPIRRGASLAWFAGLGCLLLALVWPIDGYADRSFAMHMAQHIVLVFVAPPLLALGMPVTLAMRVSGPRARERWLMPVVQSRVARLLANPVIGWLLLVAASFAVHFTGMFEAALGSATVHAAEHMLWLTAALIFWWPIVGRDPSPHRIAPPVRMLSLFLLMPPMSFLALSIYSAPRSLYATYVQVPVSERAWGLTPLADQHAAAVLMWLAGNLILVLAILFEAVAWKHEEERTELAREQTA